MPFVGTERRHMSFCNLAAIWQPNVTILTSSPFAETNVAAAGPNGRQRLLSSAYGSAAQLRLSPSWLEMLWMRKLFSDIT
jgi:hypothetical protein